MEYASTGSNALATTLGAIGTGLGVLNSTSSGNGILGGLLGGTNSNYVTKESFDLSMQLNEANRNNALLTSELNTEKKMVEVFNSLNDKINEKVSEQAAINSAQAVTNTATTATLAVAQNNINQLMALTKMVIPNGNVCPGWGQVTITPSGGTTVGTTIA